MRPTRREFLGTFAAGTVAFAAGRALSARKAAADRPNVILCMTDDQGWADTGYNGHKTLKTPNLDAMSKAGLRFDRWYSGAPVCSPTRGSCITGRHPYRYGVYFANTGHMKKQEITLAEALKTRGYATGHFGKWHLNGVRGPGVPVLDSDPHHPGHFGFEHWLTVTNFFDMNPVLSRMSQFEEFVGDFAGHIGDNRVLACNGGACVCGSDRFFVAWAEDIVSVRPVCWFDSEIGDITDP